MRARAGVEFTTIQVEGQRDKCESQQIDNTKAEERPATFGLYLSEGLGATSAPFGFRLGRDSPHRIHQPLATARKDDLSTSLHLPVFTEVDRLLQFSQFVRHQLLD